MELKIYDKANNLRLTASPNSSSTVTEEIGGECSVSASFTHTAYVPLDVDDYIDLEGVRYKVKSRYRPKQKNTQTYEYSVKFYAPLHDAEDTLMLFQEGGTTSEFSYDGGPREHLQLWIDNMNRRAGGNLWSIGTVITADNKTIDYRNVKCWDAAFGSNGIAATFETEMWADGYVINLCKAERGEMVELGYLHGLTNLAQEDNGEVKFFTRLFPLGSTRNIDATKYGYSRLQLPDRSLYVDKNVDLYGVKEETEEAAFSEIYPQYVGTVSSVRTEEKTSEEGRKYTVYYFKDNGMTWNPNNYKIPDLDYMLEFQTGELAGRGTDGSFQAAWHEDTREWEIINVYPDETTQIPGGVIVPNPGDQYIPWNFAMPQEYITAAEQEYKQAVNDFLNTYSFDPNKYNGTTDRNYIEKNGTPLRIGWNVRLLSEQYFGSTGGYKDTRIIKVQRKLNDLCQATITCSDEVGSGWKSSVDNSLGSLQDANHNLSQSYEKLHNDMMEGFASIKNLWELKQDDYGNYYIYTKYNILGRKGITSYAEADVKVPSVFDGLPLDNTTIRKNPETGLIEVIGGTGTSFDENAMWSALSGSSDNQINKSHLTNALAGYATESWVTGKGYATESWVASKNYATTEALNAVSNKLNDFLEGSDADTIINKWKELEAFLSGMAETDNLAEILETKADKKYVDSTFVTLATKQTITGEKTFSSVLNTAAIKASGAITAPSLAVSDWVTIAGIKLRKLEDGALMLEGNLALTGALTMYASNGQSFDTIYDGLPIDNDTIYWQEVDGSRVLKAREGSGSSFDKSAMWTALAGSTTEQINKSHLTTAFTGYATESWVSGKNYAVKATTLAGYGVTDAYTKKESDGKYPTKTGSGASGTWGIGITGNAATASKWATARTITLGSYLSGSVSLDGSANVTLNANVIGLTSQGKKAAVSGTTFQEVGVRLYEVFENGYPTNYGNLLSVRGGGCGELLLAWKDQYSRIYYRSKADSGNDSWTNWNTIAFLTDNIASATKLKTARTLWGQSFNGEKNVSGNLSNVGNIVPSSDNTYTLGNATNHFEGAYVRVLRNNINREMIIAQNAANNLVFQTSGVNRVIISSDGKVGIGTTSPSYKLHVDGNVAVNTGVNVYGMTGSSWGAGNGAYEIQIPTNAQQTPILLAYDIYGGRTGTSRYFSIEILNESNRNVRMLVQGQHVIELLPSKVTIFKDLLVEGGGTFYSSDIRYKSIMQQVNLSLLDIAKAPSFVYRWNKKGMKRDRLNLGGSAQYAQKILPWAVENSNNFLSMDYATVAYTFAVHTARHLLTYESRTDKKIKKLENRVKYLEKQLKKLGYEEVRTLDDQSV